MYKLSSQHYAAIVTALKIAAGSGGSEKRQCTRMEIQAPVRLGIMSDNKVVRCSIALSRDVSATGAGLCQSTKFASKETFMLALPCGKSQVIMVCNAIFCRPLADGIYCVGAQFLSEANAEQAQEFRLAAVAPAKPIAA